MMYIVSWVGVLFCILGNSIIIMGEPKYMFFAMWVCSFGNLILSIFNIYLELYQLATFSMFSLFLSSIGILKWKGKF